MAHLARYGILLVAVAFAAMAFFNLDAPWNWLVPLALVIAGSVLAERAFNRLATIAEKQRDLEDRTRNPPL